MFRRNQTTPNNRSISYQKKVVEQNTSSRIKQGFFNMTTNAAFSINGGVSKLKDFFTTESNNKNSVICIHGKVFKNQQEAKQQIMKIIWFSYRNIPGLAKNINCDTGWGCLIRVGQMALAAGLKLYLTSKFGGKQLIYQQVIVAFVQNGGTNQKYSLKKIVECAKAKQFDIDYGSWFKVSQICDVLVTLHTQNPTKNTQNLQLIHFKNSMVYIDKILKKLNKPVCKCTKPRINCLKCVNSQVQREQQKKQIKNQIISITKSLKPDYYDPRKQKPQLNYLIRSQNNTSKISKIKLQKKAMLFVSNRIGINKIQETEYRQLIQLLSLDCSLGIIGGVPKKGYYFVGYSGQQLIYLDPHKVQNQMTLANLHLIIRSFSCDQMRKVNRVDIDPSVAFVFYIEDMDSLNKLYSKIQQMNSRYQNAIIQASWADSYQQQQQRRISKISQESGEGDDLENSFIEQL